MTDRGIQWRLSLVFFLLAAMPGCWVPVVSNVLAARGWAALTDWVFVIPSIGALISPLFLGALADQRVNAEKILAGVLALNSLFTAGAFWFVGQGNSQGWFFFFFIMKALVGAPSWSLLMVVALTHIKEPERSFGLIRVWGTVGWMVAGWSVSLLALDESPNTGIFAAVMGMSAAVMSLLLPSTPPEGIKSTSLRDSLGFRAFSVLKNRDTGVYFLTAFLFSIPLAAYYPYTSKFLKSLGVEHVAAFLSIGQVSECVGMLLMGWTFRRMRLRWIFLVALGAGTLRYGGYLLAAVSGQVLPPTAQLGIVALGILMHGVCWTLFFESGKIFVNRRVEPQLRGQAQSLLTVVTGGLATILGVFLSGLLYRWCVEGGGPGWSGFWLILAVLCGVGMLVFGLGYQGQPVPRAPEKS